ncbi:MAG: aminotransferase class V-fold PLP-dependent enzyme [Oscillospiraceae bacterium]|jgi:cysteine desulfurase family protein|nr:aminotransferase class V-fold PLP-dependent enzyme [Oscillospiraceae bacterium]
MKNNVYLDNAATTLIKPRAVAAAMKNAVGTLASPGRGGHAASMRAAEIAFDCRELAAQLFNVSDPSNVIFTSNATHGLNIAVKALAKRGSRVLVSGYEHNSVMRPLRAAGAELIIARSELFEPESAVFEFERRLDAGGIDLVVTTAMSNVFGFILPVERVAALCRERGVPLIIDASQSAGSLPLDFDALGADFIAMPGHKGLYGPQGTGLLLCRDYTDGIIQGGSGSNSLSDTMPDFLPDGLEAGTHNMPGIAGLREGLKFVLSRGVAQIGAHAARLISIARRELASVPGVTVFGSDRAQGGVLSFTLENLGCEDIAERLNERGIAVRAGLHCAPEAHRTAGTISRGTVRASVSAFNTERDIAKLISVVKRLQKF